jgi:hypothetical protein
LTIFFSYQSVALADKPVQKRFCRLEIGRVEPLGEPVVDRLEERYCISGTPLIPKQSGEARCGA